MGSKTEISGLQPIEKELSYESVDREIEDTLEAYQGFLRLLQVKFPVIEQKYPDEKHLGKVKKAIDGMAEKLNFLTEFISDQSKIKTASTPANYRQTVFNQIAHQFNQILAGIRILDLTKMKHADDPDVIEIYSQLDTLPVFDAITLQRAIGS